MKGKIAVRKNDAVMNELIRRSNVKRHNDYAARIKLKDDQFRAMDIATKQQELDRLHAANVHGGGLDAIRFNRMNALKELVAKYKK